MKSYTVFFIGLKIALVLQFMLIIAHRQTKDSRVYKATEVIFKTALFLFLEYSAFNGSLSIIPFEDRMIVSFAGGLLFFDAMYNDLPELVTALKRYKNIPNNLNYLWVGVASV
jgi:Ca2+/Na+ antiporter